MGGKLYIQTGKVKDVSKQMVATFSSFTEAPEQIKF